MNELEKWERTIVVYIAKELCAIFYLGFNIWAPLWGSSHIELKLIRKCAVSYDYIRIWTSIYSACWFICWLIGNYQAGKIIFIWWFWSLLSMYYYFQLIKRCCLQGWKPLQLNSFTSWELYIYIYVKKINNVCSTEWKIWEDQPYLN